MGVLPMHALVDFMICLSRSPVVLLTSGVCLVLIPTFHLETYRQYLYMFIAAIPLLIFFLSINYKRKDDDVLADDGFNK